MGTKARPKQIRVTPATLRAHDACYPNTKIAKLFGSRKSVTLLQVLRYPQISAEDKIWVAARYLSAKDARLFACWCAERITPQTPTSAETIRVAREFAHGRATQDELLAADRAADWATDRAADWAADWAADQAADWATDWAAEYQVQVDRVIEHIKGKELT